MTTVNRRDFLKGALFALFSGGAAAAFGFEPEQGKVLNLQAGMGMADAEEIKYTFTSENPSDDEVKQVIKEIMEKVCSESFFDQDEAIDHCQNSMGIALMSMHQQGVIREYTVAGMPGPPMEGSMTLTVCYSRNHYPEGDMTVLTALVASDTLAKLGGGNKGLDADEA